MANEDVTLVPGGVWLVTGEGTDFERAHYAVGQSVDLLRQQGAEFISGPTKNADGQYTRIEDPRPALEAAAAAAAAPSVASEEETVLPEPETPAAEPEPAQSAPEPEAEETSEEASETPAAEESEESAT